MRNTGSGHRTCQNEGFGRGQFTKNGVPDDDVSCFGYGRCTDECREANTEDAYYIQWGVDDPDIGWICGSKETSLSNMRLRYSAYESNDSIIGMYGCMADGKGADTSYATGLKYGYWSNRY